MKALIAFLSIALLCSCNSDDSTEQFVYDVTAEFSLKDDKGNDLLNPDNANAIDESEIKIFYVLNGEPKEVFDGNMDYPRNFFISQYSPESEY